MIGGITGRDLVGWGVPQGPWYRTAIEMANNMRRDGVGDDLIRDNLLVFAREQDEAREARLRELEAIPTGVLPPPRRRDGLPPTAPLRIYGEHDEKTLRQMSRCLSIGSAARGVLCADGHLGYAHPIGGVVAYEEHISISGVGFDIACGNMAVRLDTRYIDICDRAQQIADDISRAVSFGIGRVNDERVEHPVLDDSDLWAAVEGAEKLRTKAAAQLGTVGSGNHYVDLFEDKEGYVWIGVHFGSRGLGHGITTEYLRLVGAKDGMEVDPALLPTEHDLGRSYIAGLQLAGQYAYAGREWVVERVRGIIGGRITDMVHNHHNWAWWEYYGGRGYWVVRKGATPARPGQRGFVGGSMGECAVILSGVDSALSRESLYSTVHGAGRVMSRTEARGKLWKNEAGEEVRLPGRIDPGAWRAWVEDAGVTLVGGEVDEAPQAYRRLPDVLAAHAGTILIHHQLRPFVVVMASAGVRDPYKD